MGGPVLKHAHKILLPKLQQQYKFQTMISTLEADDLIAVTKNYIRGKYPDKPIYIITNDHDLLQLADDNTASYKS